MNQGEDFGSYADVNTMRGRDFPSIKQFTVFLENRVEMLRASGRNYKDLERDGILLVVTQANCNYYRGAEYDINCAKDQT